MSEKIFTHVMIFLFLSANVYAQDSQDSLGTERLYDLSIEQLMNIQVVTSAGVEQTVSEAPSTMIVITAQQIRERGYEELTDALRDISGVDIIQIYGEASSFITFRGMYGDENRRILFMIDGIVENNINGGFEFAGPAYTLQNVERIELIWGPASALYGANAYSAVINVITKKGKDVNGLEFRKANGSYNLSTENMIFGIEKNAAKTIQKQAIDFVVSGSRYNTDGPKFRSWDPRYSNSYIKNSLSINTTFSYELTKLKTSLGFRAYKTAGGLGQLAASPTKLMGLAEAGNMNTGIGGIIMSDYNNERASYFETYARTIFLQSEFIPNAKLNILFRGQYRATGQSPDSYAYVVQPGKGFANRSRYAFNDYRARIELAGNYNFNKNHSLSLGVQFSQDNVERGLRELNVDTSIRMIDNIPVMNLKATFKERKYTIQDNFGAYAQYILNTNLLRKTNFTIGTRYDINSIYGSTINPRVGVVIQPYEKMTFKLLYGSAFRAPSNFELYSVGTNRIANPELEPEKIKTYEANVMYSPFKFLLVHTCFFHNDLTDLIITGVPLGNGLFQNQNVGTAQVNGIQARIDIIPSSTLSGFINFTYQDANQNNGSITTPVPNIADLKGNIGLSWHVQDLLRISVIENMVGDRSVMTINPLGKVNGYAVTNLSITTDNLFENKISVGLTIRNLFNQKYYDPGSRLADGNFYPTVIDQPGINGMLRVTVKI